MKRTAVYMGGFLALVCSLALSQTAFAGGSAFEVKQYSLGEKEVSQGDKNILVNGTRIRAFLDTEISQVTFACTGSGVFENVRLYNGSKYLGQSTESYYDASDEVQREVFDVNIGIQKDGFTFLRVIADSVMGNSGGSVDCAITDFEATLRGHDYQVSTSGNMGIDGQDTTFHFEYVAEEVDVCEDSKNMGGSQIICVGETYTYEGLNIISTNLYANAHFAVFKTNASTGYDSNYFVVKAGERFVLTSKNSEKINVYYRGMDANEQPHFFINAN